MGERLPRAERLLDEMLAKAPNSKPGPKESGPTQVSNSEAPTLCDLEIDKKLSSALGFHQEPLAWFEALLGFSVCPPEPR